MGASGTDKSFQGVNEFQGIYDVIDPTLGCHNAGTGDATGVMP